MDLITETATPGHFASAGEGDPVPMNEQLAQEASARLFRSIRAGRSWVRAREATGDTPRVAACVPMKPGNDGPPVFMIPGAPGSILQIGAIAAAMSVPMPVYAIKPRGIEESEVPCETVREMAEYAIGAIRTLRPSGPYLFVGYSAGGLVALEMAQQLRAAGETVPLVVLLDTYPSRQVWPLRCHADILARQSVNAIMSLRHYSPAEAMREIGRRIRGLSEYLSASGVTMLSPAPLIPEGVTAASRRVHRASVNAGEAYRPSPYPGKVIFVQPEEVPNLEPRIPGQVWRRYLTDLEVRRVPGSHLGIVEAGAPVTAATITGCLADIGLL